SQIAKEQFPDVVIPTFLVNTVYPGASPSDIENLVTRHLEKNIRSEKDIKKVTSQSLQDMSMIQVEFQTGVETNEAKQRINNAIDKSKQDLPNDLPDDPVVIEINVSDIPIMSINLSGDQDLVTLKKYADMAQDQIEGLQEINRVDIVGALDREIQINVDMYKMQAAGVSFSAIQQAIAYENLTVSAGTLKMGGMARSLRVVGEFADIETIRNIKLTGSGGAKVAIREIADVVDGFLEQESYARLNGENVVTLSVVKKSGENLLDASDKVKEIMSTLQKTSFPKDLQIIYTGEQSKFTRSMLKELNNTIIMGFILVITVLMFFMGVTNAFFVGMAVPLSMFLAYIVLPGIGYTMNMLVMFSFIFALGIVVDDAIVVIENTHRIFMKEKDLSIVDAAKKAAGEIFLPILSGTLTTLAPFFPLIFWEGVTGQFMVYIPVTVIITLLASLLVAYTINPVFAVSFMKRDQEHSMDEKKKKNRKIYSYALTLLLLSVPFYLIKQSFVGNLLLILTVLYLFYNLWLKYVIRHFQNFQLPALMRGYEKILRYALYGKRPYYFLYGTIGILIFSFVLVGVMSPPIVFFPENEPSTISVFVKLPEGTDVNRTNEVAKKVEVMINGILGEGNPDVESVQTNVAAAASENSMDGGSIMYNKAKITINFKEFADRTGPSTYTYQEAIREEVKKLPGVEVTLAQDEMGPPTAKPVNIEISGEEMPALIATSKKLKAFLIDSVGIRGMEDLRSNFIDNKPEIIIDVDRLRANELGITTGQIGSAFRTSVYGTEISKYREGKDQYPIMLRYKKEQRENIDALMESQLTLAGMSGVRQIPMSAFSTIRYNDSYGAISRIDEKRVITLSSNVLNEYNATEINREIAAALPRFTMPDGVTVQITGEQEDQQEAVEFLSLAFGIAIFIILFILITQFNSIMRMVIILSEVIFSISGVLLGFSLFRMPISVIMTGMGIIALAGIVIRNGILLVEFTDVLKGRGMSTREAIIQAGKTRIIPVLLTAAATILGLVPLAISLNIDLVSLVSSFNPHIHFGGDTGAFFGPMAWSIIFGLSFATFLTLIMIPVMYFIGYSSSIFTERRVRKFKL
ncbi:MAG: efflux RND transporter permease subunit, partial [Bacteroidales bacterium]|nr:efflux RND transporter permease subunit [Bacteroidales bacterium]